MLQVLNPAQDFSIFSIRDEAEYSKTFHDLLNPCISNVNLPELIQSSC
jgi:hypothetical protein